MFYPSLDIKTLNHIFVYNLDILNDHFNYEEKY